MCLFSKPVPCLTPPVERRTTRRTTQPLSLSLSSSSSRTNKRQKARRPHSASVAPPHEKFSENSTGMLLEKRRKRARSALRAFALVETARVQLTGTGTATAVVPAERSDGASTQRTATVNHSAPLATSLTMPSSSSLALSATPGHPPNTVPSSSLSVSMASNGAARSAGARAADSRVLLSRANRMHALVVDRFRSLDLRRSRRCELLEEILRLKKMMTELQEEVDATTRTVESMERLVRHLQGLSTTSAVSTASSSSSEPTRSRQEFLQSMDNALRLQVTQSRAIEGRAKSDVSERCRQESFGSPGSS